MKRPHDAPVHAVKQVEPPPSPFEPPKMVFDRVVLQIIDLARALGSSGLAPAASALSHGSQARSVAVSEGTPAAEALARALGAVGSKSVQKLLTLTIAGQEAKEISAVRAAMAASKVGSRAAVERLLLHGARLAELLQRGRAIAVATGLEIDGSIADWQSQSAQTLEQRAWLSFGAQLARFQPNDWTCFGVMERPGGKRVTKLYLRVTKNAWWSFRKLLDRPSPAMVEQDRRRGLLTPLTITSLAGMADARYPAEARALRRALQAIQARVGTPSPSTTSS